jgi:hypothetical protein
MHECEGKNKYRFINWIEIISRTLLNKKYRYVHSCQHNCCYLCYQQIDEWEMKLCFKCRKMKLFFTIQFATIKLALSRYLYFLNNISFFPRIMFFLMYAKWKILIFLYLEFSPRRIILHEIIAFCETVNYFQVKKQTW